MASALWVCLVAAQVLLAGTFSEPKLSCSFGVTRTAPPRHLWDALSAVPSDASVHTVERH